MVCEGEPISDNADWLTNMRRQMTQEIMQCSLASFPSTLPANGVRSEWTMNSIQPVMLGWRREFPVGSGIQNVGQTCFLALILQVLFHCPPFVEWLMAIEEHQLKCKERQRIERSKENSSPQPCITCLLAEYLNATFRQSVLDPSSFVQCIPYFGGNYVCNEQQDAHEFLTKLLERLQFEFKITFGLPKSAPNTGDCTPIHDIFGGGFRTCVCCSRCGRVSFSRKQFLNLTLDIQQAMSIKSGLDETFRKQTLSGYRCVKCHRYVSATKHVQIENVPQVLVIHLKRFGENGTKINKFVRYPVVLEIRDYIVPSSNFTGVSKYKLISTVSHLSKMAGSGHYVAVAQCSDMSFHKFDDSKVTSSSLRICLEQPAYLLMYEQLKQ